MVLMVLWEEDTTSMTRLSTRLHLDFGTLTPLLKRMEQKSLLSRATDNTMKELESLQ